MAADKIVVENDQKMCVCERLCVYRVEKKCKCDPKVRWSVSDRKHPIKWTTNKEKNITKKCKDV